MRSFHLSLILSLITAFGSSTLADDNTQRAPEFQVLDHFVGNWDLQVTETLSGGEPASYESTSIRTWSRGGGFIRFEDVAKGRPETHILMTYDPEEKNYPAVFMSGPSRFNLTGTWDESTRVMSFTGTLPDGNRLSSTHRFVSKTKAEVSAVITNPDGEVVAKVSHTQTRSEKSSEGIWQLDTNGDGFIDLAEMRAASLGGSTTAEQVLGFADTNRDGKISRGEVTQYNDFKAASQRAGTKERKAVENIIRSMDQDGDGKISRKEASEFLKPYFEQVDANGDGFIDTNEAWGMAYAVRRQPGQGPATAQQIIAYMDKNSDGKISKDEASAELKPHFDQIDTNNDGAIDVKEAQVMADFVNRQY